MATTEDLDVFCRAVEARSEEHREAMDIAISQGWLAIASSVLRMELDSMIRVIYLLRRPDARERILASCVAGEGFKDGRNRISDRQMVDVAVTVNGWVPVVYGFGNKFVHLTDAHDYAEADPFQAFEHKNEAIRYLDHYHRDAVPGRLLEHSPTLQDIARYAPHVLRKIASNLRVHISDLRAAVNQDNSTPAAEVRRTDRGNAGS
jgi:hypothetical protein